MCIIIRSIHLSNLRPKRINSHSTLFAEKGANWAKKANAVKIYLSPAFRFMVEYVFKLGFLDGYYGWFIAKENARYTYLKYKKLG
ncbi:MAG: hypothetical protein U0X91_19585 [Spirosomataceae bacterium]